MTPIFADTFYFLALLSRADRQHAAALRYAMAADRPILTTAWVLTEVADGLSPALTRPQFLALLTRLDSSAEAEIVGPSADLWRRGIDLYARRPDKARRLHLVCGHVRPRDQRSAHRRPPLRTGGIRRIVEMT